MKQNKQQSTFVNIGSSSLLIIFLVLCLTTFAILSLSSAQSDYNFSKKLADHKTEYYEASSRAEMILGEIDRILAKTAVAENTGTDMTPGTGADTSAVTALLDGREIDSIILSCYSASTNTDTNTDIGTDSSTGTDTGTIISYQVPSGEKQALKVTLLVTNDSEHENYYKIQTWQLISTADWEADDSIKLMPVGQ